MGRKGERFGRIDVKEIRFRGKRAEEKGRTNEGRNNVVVTSPGTKSTRSIA